MRRRPGPLLIVTFALAMLTTAPADAHRAATSRTDGIRIEPLSHGQMAVIDANRAAVLALAERARGDETHRRLLNYGKLQFAFCLWGVMPGTLDDETSPFNGCAHAYLAATRTLLTHMRERPDADPAVAALAAKVDHELLLEGTLALCLYSGEPYNTADLVLPEWTAVPNHPPTVLAAAGAFGVMAGGGYLATRRRRAHAAAGYRAIASIVSTSTCCSRCAASASSVSSTIASYTRPPTAGGTPRRDSQAARWRSFEKKPCT